MAQPESFLTIELSLSRRLNRIWQQDVAEPILRKLIPAAESGDFATASAMLDELTFQPLLDQRRFVRLMLLSAFMLGQNFFADDVAGGQLASGEIETPPQVDTAVEALLGGIQVSLFPSVVAPARAVLELEQGEEATPARTRALGILAEILKQADLALATRLNAAVAVGGKQVVEIGANLNTARLASFGALAQAQSQGVRTFQVNEILDALTCPVCRRMHGRTFTVAPPLERLGQQLLITDPQQLKAAAPFPKQSRAGLIDLTNLNQGQLQEKGWDTPPYHPYCRGILSRVGTVPASERIPFVPPVGAIRAVVGDPLARLRRPATRRIRQPGEEPEGQPQ